MGESALRSHAKAESHKNNEKSMSVSFVNWFIKEESKQVTPSTSSFAQYSVASLTVPPPPPTPSTSGRAIASSTVSNYVSKNEVLKAEIIWTMRTIMKHESYKSNENINNIFQSMFPDSEIARKFTLGERKTSYICVFGLADHFKSLLIEKIKGPFVALFDESLNKKMQEKQMDLHVRFWDSELQQVVTRYFRARQSRGLSCTFQGGIRRTKYEELGTD